VNLKAYKSIVLFVLIVGLAGCFKGVRQQDLDAWAGMPVEALETHSFFITVPLYKTKTESGIEVWNYANGGASVASCFTNASAYDGDGYVSGNAATNCISQKVICNNIFYIKNGIVLEYAPTGRCYTEEFLQPEARYRRLIAQ
jgi:hypothetical protein